jgi:hypothetical protein
MSRSEWLIHTARHNASKPLPLRWMLLTKFTGCCVIALLSAVEIGMGIARSVWAVPFTFDDLARWAPFFILAGSIAAAQTQLQGLLDGAYFGGPCDRSRSQPANSPED